VLNDKCEVYVEGKKLWHVETMQATRALPLMVSHIM